MRFLTAFTLVFALGGAASHAADEAATASSVGKKIDQFQMADFRGKQHSLADYKDKQAVVLAFIGTECPLAKLYAPRLVEMSKEFGSRGVAFVGVASNRQDSVTEIAAYARIHGIGFPILKDLNNELADRIGATRTPEVFVLDAQGVVRYQGRIDDQYGLTIGSNYAKPTLGERDLANALEEILAGKQVTNAHQPATGCLIGRVREANEDSAVTYSNQIARILQNRCVECHRPGEIAPFSLTSYDEVVGWAEMIEEVVRDNRMPPWHASPDHGQFLNDRRLSDEERDAIYEWVKNGAPEGDRSQLPEPRQYAQGWAMPEPDMIVYMDDKPFTVPAEGAIEYQYFTVDPGFTEDKWIKASECRADNRGVVHHIFVFVQPPGAPGEESMMIGREGDEAREKLNSGEVELSFRSGGTRLISGTAPGVPPFVYPEGMAIYVPKRSKLIFQMHYTPNGSEQQDRSYVGFKFADPEEVRAALDVEMAINFAFQIPAHADNHRVESWREFKDDTLILDFTPHMHLRGKAFRYELVYPDGRVETLLDVPRYDFNWQITYQLADPLLAPAGSKLHCIAHFDNSEDNLANPDPTKPVRWGDQTWEEMMIGWFTQTTDIDFDSLPPERTRTAQFAKLANSGKAVVGSRLARTASRARESQKNFEALHRLVRAVCPQVDRIDISLASDDSVTFKQFAQPPVYVAYLSQSPGYEAVIKTNGKPTLGEYSGLAGPVVHNDLTVDHAPGELSHMARAARSSVHVPVKIEGQAACVNFWSRERNAFPPEAVELLTQVAQLLSTESGPAAKPADGQAELSR